MVFTLSGDLDRRLAGRGSGHRFDVPHDPESTVRTDMAALLDDAPVADRYVLHRVLGQGGAAVVHEATDTRLDRQVAVKLLRDPSRDETDRRRFVSEARLLGRLSHAHLVRVLDAGVDGETPFLVLELVRGRTLADAMVDGIPPGRLAEIGAQVALALDHVHEAGIVHRDVKPGNVLLTEDGDAKLADFGIARLVDDTQHCTRTGHLVGTVAYVAPEQVAGEPATPAIDVYGWGLVLLEALTGARAYVGTSVESALARLSRSPEVPPSLPLGWRRLLTEMTARDPRARPTARQVADRLRALETETPVASAGAVPAPRTVLAGLAAAFVLLLTVAAWPSWPGLPGPSTASAQRSTTAAADIAPAATGQGSVSTAEVAAEPPAQGRTGPASDRVRHHHGARHHRPHHHKSHHKPGHHKGKHHKPHHHGGKHHR